jgi:transcriptional regulator with XRE-family HTH domain
METFNSRLNIALIKSGKTRPEIAELIGVGTSALAKWLAGHLTPKSEQLFALSKALKVSPQWLLTGEEPKDGFKAYLAMLKEFSRIAREYDKKHPDALLDRLTEAAQGVLEVLYNKADNDMQDKEVYRARAEKAEALLAEVKRQLREVMSFIDPPR